MADGPNPFQQFLLDVFPGTPQATAFQASKREQSTGAARQEFAQEVARLQQAGTPLPQAINTVMQSPIGNKLFETDKEALSTPESLLKILAPQEAPTVSKTAAPKGVFESFSSEEKKEFLGARIKPEDQDRLSVNDYITAVAAGEKIKPEALPVGFTSGLTQQQALSAKSIGEGAKNITLIDLALRATGATTGKPLLDAMDPLAAGAAARFRAEVSGGAQLQDLLTIFMEKQGLGGKKRETAQEIAAKEVARKKAAKPSAPAKEPAPPKAPAISVQTPEGGVPELLVPPSTPQEAASLTIEQIKALNEQAKKGQIALTPEISAILKGRLIAGQ